MNQGASRLELEPRISPRWVFGLLALVGVIVVLSANPLASPSRQLTVLVIGILLQALAAAGWLMHRWSSSASRWMAVVLLVTVVYLGGRWSGLPGFLLLTVVPTALTGALIGGPAMVGVAAAESILVILAPLVLNIKAGWDEAAAALIGIWAMVATVHAVCHHVEEVSRWAWDLWQQAQSSIKDARDRRQELEQTVEGLANANRQLALANERMAALREIAEEAQRTKTAFVANVSHEFRTPLNMIIGLVGLMVETPDIYAAILSPKMRKDLETVHRNCVHLSNMVNDVLDLTRVETGRLQLHKERIDLSEIIGKSLASVQPLLRPKGLATHTGIQENLPEPYCDRTRIQQVILNLLSNAARFTERGGITVEASQQDQCVIVRVTDTGPGIAPQDVERIFEPFWRGAGDLWRDKGGTGLGLSISRQFVRSHGGRMWLESELGVGTSVFFSLPISPPLEPSARPGHSIREDWVWRERAFRTGQAGSSERLVKPRVVIWDEPGTLYPQLKRYSDDVELLNAHDLLQVVQVGPAHAVIVNAPSLDRLTPLLDMARQNLAATPIIGCSVSDRMGRTLESGALGYLVKPVTRDDLEEALQAIGKPVRQVLIVDDDPDVLELFSRLLYACDSTLEIVTASGSEEALDRVRQAAPDLMLLDIVMPDMDGWQVLEAMTRDEQLQDTTVFLVSAHDPVDSPSVSEFFLATVDEGLSFSKLLRCSLAISGLLMEPEGGSDLTPV